MSALSKPLSAPVSPQWCSDPRSPGYGPADVPGGGVMAACLPIVVVHRARGCAGRGRHQGGPMIRRGTVLAGLGGVAQPQGRRAADGRLLGRHPVPALYQMLHRVAKAQAEQSLLIHGAGGAVGTAMLQFARDARITAFGADVAAKHDLIRGLGATPIEADSSDAAMREAPRRRGPRLRPAGWREPDALATCAEAGRHANSLRVPERSSRPRRLYPARLCEAEALRLAAERARDRVLFDRSDATTASQVVQGGPGRALLDAEGGPDRPGRRRGPAFGDGVDAALP